MSDKMREALERLRREAAWVQRDEHKYAELAYSPTADTLESIADDIEAALAEQPAQCEAVAWRDHVEQRIRTWRQSFVNRSGDQLAIDDFMDAKSLDDLIDFVCDAYTAPPAPAVPEPNGAEFMTICTKCKLEFHACECAFNSDAHAFRCTKRVLIVPPAPGLPQGWMPVPVEPTRAMVQAGAKLVKENKPSPTGARDIYIEMLAAAPEVKP